MTASVSLMRRSAVLAFLVCAALAAVGRAEHDAALAAGMDRVVHKPFDISELLPLLSALRRHADRDGQDDPPAPPPPGTEPAPDLWPQLPGIDLGQEIGRAHV